jgi:hypothetical protein
VAEVIALVLSGLLATACSSGSTGDQGSGTDETSPAAVQAFQARWWSWAWTAPAGRDPVEDRTGEHCAVGQPSDLWFLAGTYGGRAMRSCDVPQGRRVVVPAVNLVAPSVQECADFMVDARGHIRLDGVEMPLLPLEAEELVVDTPDGPTTGVGCGLWVVLDALPPGEHRLTISGRSGDFRTGVEYTLHVAPPAG